MAVIARGVRPARCVCAASLVSGTGETRCKPEQCFVVELLRNQLNSVEYMLSHAKLRKATRALVQAHGDDHLDTQ